MQIDWVTVAAQIVNFLILVALLKRFLYAPILDAMQQREQRIAAQLSQAEEREVMARASEADYRDKVQELERERETIRSRTRTEAEQDRHRLLREARDAVDETRQQWQQQVQQEKVDFLDALRERTGDVVQDIARRALGDLADRRLEAQIVDTFVARLETMEPARRPAPTSAGEHIQVTTAFELDDDCRDRLTDAIRRLVHGDAEIDYRRAGTLLCGIELTAGGRRIGFSLGDHLDQIRENLDQALTLPPATERPDAADPAR
jgi:F-type H+-transporting ATPase subunit b